jgi:Tfp pilus assembly protein PilE
MRVRGITLLEVLVVSVCMAILIGASTSAVFTAIRHTSKVKASRTVYDRNARFEDRLRSILQNAYLSSVANDTNSYFFGGQDVVDVPNGTTDESQLVFTGLSQRIPSAMIESADDFETLNQSYGPEGGLSEYSLSLSPVGSAPVEQALFLRRQTPADGDPAQGGLESILDPDIDSISYEFYNGESWETSWDTTSLNPPRLPAAVRITYRRINDESDHFFIVRLIHSDATADNPVLQEIQQ